MTYPHTSADCGGFHDLVRDFEGDRPTIICLCGSTRFRDEFARVNRELTKAGVIVVAPGVFGHSGDPFTEDDKERLDALHLRKIDLADEVFVVNPPMAGWPGGYFGESTRKEIDLHWATTAGSYQEHEHWPPLDSAQHSPALRSPAEWLQRQAPGAVLGDANVRPLTEPVACKGALGLSPPRSRLVWWLNWGSGPMTDHTEHSMSRDLWRHFAGQNWASLIHIPADMKHQAEVDRAAGRSARIIDMLLIRPARKKDIGPFDLLAIEIKVTRADFFSDVREPAKQEAWRTIAHRHAYAVPTGLVRKEEVPAGSGLIEVGPGWANSIAPDVSWKTRAPYSTSPELPTSLVMTFAYRAAQAEAQVRGLSWDTRRDEDPEAMRAELVRLRAKVELQGKQLIRAREDRDAWRNVFAVTSGVPCGTCGQPIRPKSVRSGKYTDWRHIDKAHDPACQEVRERAAEARARARWDGLDEETRARHMERHGDEEMPWRIYMWSVGKIEPADLEDEEAA